MAFTGITLLKVPTMTMSIQGLIARKAQPWTVSLSVKTQFCYDREDCETG